MLIPESVDELARIELVMHSDGALSISGNVGDKKLAKRMLESAIEAVDAQVRSPSGGLVLPSGVTDAVAHSEFPLVEVGHR